MGFEFCGVIGGTACFAVVPILVGGAAVWTGSFDVAVREKHAFGRVVNWATERHVICPACLSVR